MAKIESTRKIKGLSTCVRFEKEEYKKISEESKTTGYSIPSILKDRYFKSPRPTPLLNKDDVKTIQSILGRIGNNINQIAWRWNSGIREGSEPGLEEAKLAFDKLRMVIIGSYCRCQSQ